MSDAALQPAAEWRLGFDRLERQSDLVTGVTARQWHGAGMRWREWRWLLSSTAALAAAARLSATGHHAHASASAGADAEFTVYAAGGRLPAAARAALAPLGPAASERDYDEAALMRACNPGTAVEIAPGVWIDPRGRSRLPRGATRIIVPPSPAFGDGRHPTTRLSAQLLLEQDLAGASVLDLGCGTGALGLLARTRGARRVDFADLDPAAVRTCKAVCRANGYPGARVRRGDLLDAVPANQSYDLVVGNLYADLVLRVCADPRLARIAAGRRLVLSGIAAKRERPVRAALRSAGFRIEKRVEEAWWIGLAAVGR
jgi:ribosomal protein L11 methylase PrmA